MKKQAKLTCRETVELVTDYLENALLPELEAQFETHLATCSDCHVYLDQMRQTIHLLQALTADRASSGSKQQILEKFRSWQKVNKDK